GRRLARRCRGARGGGAGAEPAGGAGVAPLHRHGRRLSMRRAVVFAVLAAAAVLAAYWLASHPGQVTIEWLGYRLEPSVGLLIVATLVFAIVVGLLYRVVRAIVGTPRRIGRALASSRRKRGYKALSQGMVA